MREYRDGNGAEPTERRRVTHTGGYMQITDLQRQAWEVAESKGLHKDLDDTVTFGRREVALAAMAPLYQAVTLLTQYVKRHGLLMNETCHEDLDSLFHEILRRYNDIQDAFYRDKTDTADVSDTLPAILRLVLVHTEVDEAIDAVEKRTPDLVGDELADILIRVGDLAECLGIDLDAHVEAKIAKNRTRPYKYGTPQEAKA